MRNRCRSGRSWSERLLERDDATDATGAEVASWHGFVTDAESGERSAWHRVGDLARIIERRLAPSGGRRGTGEASMTAPTLTDVVDGMLNQLRARLQPALPGLPDPNVSLERVTERLVGLGNHRGGEPSGSLGVRTLRGGRLDARVRFQLWGGEIPVVDDIVDVLHTTLLDDRDALRAAGFLRMSAVETTLAEQLEVVDGWRKATSYDVLYEYSYVDSDDADSLIARIKVTTDPERTGSPDRELEEIVDELVRWDQLATPELVVRGPRAVARISALAFVPGPALGGSVVVARSDGGGPVTHLASLQGFLAMATGPAALVNADVTLSPAGFLTALGAVGSDLVLGDLDANGMPDTYEGFDRRLDPVMELSAGDRLTLTYLPPGPGPALDQTAVVYLQVNAP